MNWTMTTINQKDADQDQLIAMLEAPEVQRVYPNVSYSLYTDTSLPFMGLSTDGNGEKMIMVNTQKYRSDLFYIAPFYHTEIPESIKKLIVIDIDLEFR